jgi:outer membrane protein
MTNPWTKSLLRSLVFAASASVLATNAHASPKSVVVVTDGPVPDERVDIFVTALREVAGSSIEIAEDIPVIAGDWTAVSVSAALDQAYAQNPDLVLAIGIGASSAAVRQDTAPVPTVAPWVLDPVLQELTDNPTDNIYPVKVHLGLSRHVDSLRAMSGAQTIALLVEPTGIDRLGIRAAPENMTLVPLSKAPEAPLSALGEDIDGVIIAPLDRTDEAGREALAQQLLARGLPSFTLAGPEELARGFMMSNTSLGDPIGVARNAALLGVAVLRGNPIDDASWSPTEGGQLALNGETVAKLGVAVPFDVLIRAEVRGDPSDDVASEDLDTIIALAIEQSPDLIASQAEVDAARSDLIRSWSLWMPQAGVSASAGLVDKRLADSSLGQVAPASVGMDASVDQLLYDVMARAAIPVQQRLQAGRVAGFDARSLDVVANVALAYVNALRADALIDVRRTDLLLLQANLDAARIRVAVGDATDAEEARWQSEIAQARSTLVDAFVARRSAQMSVNQRVGREPGTRFKPEASMTDALLSTFSNSVVGRGLDNPTSLRRLGDAMVDLGLERSPELTQLDLGINAQEAYLGATKKTYFVPSIGANITGTWNAWRSDAGQALDLSGLPVGIDLSFPEKPPVYATAGLSATLPLFEGRARIADQSEATYDLTKLEARRLELKQLLSLRIRTAVLNLEGAYQRVNMAEISVQGADRNLNWASDAYARGLATQLQLLDARTAVLQANVALTDARFGFLAAIIESQRATATLSHPGNPIDDDAIAQKLTALLSEDVE